MLKPSIYTLIHIVINSVDKFVVGKVEKFFLSKIGGGRRKMLNLNEIRKKR